MRGGMNSFKGQVATLQHLQVVPSPYNVNLCRAYYLTTRHPCTTKRESACSWGLWATHECVPNVGKLFCA